MSDEHTGPASAGKYTERDGRGDEIDRMAAERDEAVACRNRFKGLWEDVSESRKFEADTNAALKNEIASMALRLADTTEGREAYAAGQEHLQRQMEEASKAADETRARLIAERDTMIGQRDRIAAQLTERTEELDALKDDRANLRGKVRELRLSVGSLQAAYDAIRTERDAMTGQRETIAAQLTQRTAERDEADRRVDRLLMKRRSQARADAGDWQDKAEERIVALEDNAHCPEQEEANYTGTVPPPAPVTPSPQCPSCSHWDDACTSSLLAACTSSLLAAIDRRGRCSRFEHRGPISRFEPDQDSATKVKQLEAKLEAKFANAVKMKQHIAEQLRAAVSQADIIAELTAECGEANDERARVAALEEDVSDLESEAEAQADHICELDRLIARLRSQRDALRQAQPASAVDPCATCRKSCDHCQHNSIRDLGGFMCDQSECVHPKPSCLECEDGSGYEAVQTATETVCVAPPDVGAALTEPELAQQCQMCEGCASPVAVDHEDAGSCLRWRQHRHPEPYRGLDQEARNAAWVARGELLVSCKDLRAMEDDGLDNDESHMAACASVQAWSAAWVALRGA